MLIDKAKKNNKFDFFYIFEGDTCKKINKS